MCFLQAENKNEAPQYDGTWRDADPADVKAKMDAGVPYTYRFKVPKGKVRPETATTVAPEHEDSHGFGVARRISWVMLLDV